MTFLKRIIFLYVLLVAPFAATAEIFDEYPTLFAHVNGVSIAYQDMGTRKGSPVVLVGTRCPAHLLGGPSCTRPGGTWLPGCAAG